jgi:hypothetical protein
MIRIDYVVGGFEKYVVGTLIEEDDDFYVVRGQRDGKIFKINKMTCREVREDAE